MVKATVSKLTNVPNVAAGLIIAMVAIAIVNRNIGGVRRFTGSAS